MKEKMERFARGEFDDCLPKVELPEKPLSWEMEPETSFSGYLRFRSENGLRIRGYVLCSDGNMKISTQVSALYRSSISLRNYNAIHFQDSFLR